jgi:hypothetical protein
MYSHETYIDTLEHSSLPKFKLPKRRDPCSGKTEKAYICFRGVSHLLANASRRILKLLWPHNFQMKHQRLLEAQVPNTGAWFLKLPDFQDWNDSPASSLLWCQGQGNHSPNFVSAD